MSIGVYGRRPERAACDGQAHSGDAKNLSKPHIGDDRSVTGNAVWECESLSIRDAVVGNQTMRQAARLAASQAYAKRRRERAQRDRRLEKLAIEVLTALGERDATIAATEQRAGAALQAMITDESLTVSEAVQWCAGAISHREATRLRHLTAGIQQPG
jgi:hypothetical protein